MDVVVVELTYQYMYEYKRWMDGWMDGQGPKGIACLLALCAASMLSISVHVPSGSRSLFLFLN